MRALRPIGPPPLRWLTLLPRVAAVLDRLGLRGGEVLAPRGAPTAPGWRALGLSDAVAGPIRAPSLLVRAEGGSQFLVVDPDRAVGVPAALAVAIRRLSQGGAPGREVGRLVAGASAEARAGLAVLFAAFGYGSRGAGTMSAGPVPTTRSGARTGA